MHDEKVCVHCGIAADVNDCESQLRSVDLSDYEEWVHSDPDCPAKSYKEYRIFEKDMVKLQRMQKERHNHQQLEEYNKLRGLSHWQKVNIHGNKENE